MLPLLPSILHIPASHRARTLSRSPHTRYHRKPLLLILPTQLLPIPALLLLRPQRHLRARNNQEHTRTPRPIDEQYPNPRNRLEQVIRARHPAKPESARYAALRAAWRAEVAQHQVRIQVRELSHREKRQAGVREQRVAFGCGDGGRRVCEVRDQET